MAAVGRWQPALVCVQTHAAGGRQRPTELLRKAHYRTTANAMWLWLAAIREQLEAWQHSLLRADAAQHHRHQRAAQRSLGVAARSRE